MSPSDHDAFVLPDLSEAVHRIDHDGPYFTSHGRGNAASTPHGSG